MKKFLPLVACLILSSTLLAQTVKFKELEEQILDHYNYGEYEEMLSLAPEMLKEEPWRGEGHYYSAVAWFELKDYQKAQEYLELAEKQATPELRERLVELRKNIPNRQAQDEKILSAEALLKKGKKKEAAALFAEAWELYKYSGVPAQRAVDLFLELKDYEQAIRILEDPVFEGDLASAAYIEKIAQYPEYKAIKAYETAMSEGKLNFVYGDDDDALTNFEAALRLRPNDAKALEFRNAVLDAMAWKKALELNSVKGYKNYLRDKDNQLYREDAKARIAAAREALKIIRPDRAFMTYVYDSIAPYGLSFGSLKNSSVGLYMAGSINEDVFTTSTYFTVENSGAIDGSTDEVATGEEMTGYGDVVLGLTRKLTYPLWIYAGGGAAFTTKYHGYEGISGTEWAKNTDTSGIDALVDAGLIIDLSGFSLRGGVKTDLTKYRWSAGIGFTF